MNDKISIDKNGDSIKYDLGNGKFLLMECSPKTQKDDCWGVFYYDSDPQKSDMKLCCDIVQKNDAYVIENISPLIKQFPNLKISCLKEICNDPLKKPEDFFGEFGDIVTSK